MYGFSREVYFAFIAGLVPEVSVKLILSELERNLAVLYDALNKKAEEREML